MQATPTFHDAALKAKVGDFGRALMGVLREKDAEKGRPNAGFANNMNFGQDLKEVWEKETIEKLKRVRQRWDEKNVFWSPVNRV